jgi:DNA-binding transcriptional LysR family regulator
VEFKFIKNNTAQTVNSFGIGLNIPDNSEALSIKLINRLKFRDLNLIICIYEFRSIRAASVKLNVSQATATKRLQEIEAAVGAQLFVRLPTSLRATGECDVVYQACLQMKAATRTLATKLHEKQQGAGAKIVIGIGCSYLTPPVTRLLQILAEQAPVLNISLVIDNTDTITQGLRDGSIDLALGITLGPRDEDLITYKLPAINVVPVASSNHILLCNLLKNLSEKSASAESNIFNHKILTTQRWITLPQGDPLRLALQKLFPEGIEHGVFEANSLNTIAELLKGTSFLALLPESYAEELSKSKMIVLLPFYQKLQVFDYYAAHNNHRELCAVGNMLVQNLTSNQY